MSVHSRIQLLKTPFFSANMLGAVTAVFLPTLIDFNAPAAGVLALSSAVSAVWVLLLYTRLAAQTRSVSATLPPKPHSLPLETAAVSLVGLAASLLAIQLEMRGAALPAVFAFVLCSAALFAQAFARSQNVAIQWLPQLGLLIAVTITPLRSHVVTWGESQPIGFVWPFALFPIALAYALNKRVAKNWRRLHAGDVTPIFLYDPKVFETRRMRRPEARWMRVERTFLHVAEFPHAVATNLSAAALGIQRFTRRPGRLAAIILAVGATAAAAIGGVFHFLPMGQTVIMRDTMQAVCLTSVTLVLAGSAGFSLAERSTLLKRVGRRATILVLQRQTIGCVIRIASLIVVLSIALEAALFAAGISAFTLSDLHRIVLFFALCLSLAAPSVAWLQSLASSSLESNPLSPGRIGLVVLLIVPFAGLFAGGSIGFGLLWTTQPSAVSTLLLAEAAAVTVLAALAHGILLPQARRQFLSRDL